jgi:hypothetical protein
MHTRTAPPVGYGPWYPGDDAPDLCAAGLTPLPPLGATDWIEDHGPDGTRFGRHRVWCTSRPLTAAARRRLAAAGWMVRQDAGVTRFSRPRL